MSASALTLPIEGPAPNPTESSPGARTDQVPSVQPGAPDKGWLISRRIDFWVACGGASAALLAVLAVLLLRGDKELDWVDFVFAELHVGATYDALVRRRLWARMPIDVILIPLVILTATYALMLGDKSIYVFTVLMYLAVWHRGRQNFGLGRFYQRQAGGAVSSWHTWLFGGAIYAPMIASTLFYTTAYPEKYEGSIYYALPAFHGRYELNIVSGVIALLWVLSYLLYTVVVNRRADRAGPSSAGGENAPAARIHDGERWIVMAHAVAFFSAYFLGAWKSSFIIVLAVHHEVQYLYFCYAMARRDPTRRPDTRRRELILLATFSILPIVGLLSAVGTNVSGLKWLAPSGVGLLLCHYWIDGRIWKGKAMRPA